MNIQNVNAISICRTFILGVVAVLAVKTIDIQVLNREIYQQETKNMVTQTKNVYAERGRIMDRNGVVLADNLRDNENATDFTRIFLQGKLASQIVGKVGYNGIGSMGVERTFDSRLRGNEGYRLSYQDASRHEIYGRSENVAEAEPGKNLVLTIDKNMQEIVENALKKVTADYLAISASAVVVDPYTGEILAMATYPTYDPNSKVKAVNSVFRNDILSMSYEPGSTFKVVTAAAALENNVIPVDTIFKDEGRCWEWNPRSKKICDTHVYGDMDMGEAMVQSSNVVYAKIADKVGAERLYRMARNLGFGMKTSEDFYGEESGKIYQPYELTRDDRTLKTMGFGHAVMVTPIQLVMAYSAVANGGFLMKPRIVKEWLDSKGNLVEKTQPDTIRHVISEKTAASLRQMLYRVVNGNGTARKVFSKKIPDVIFGGKTGTAEKYNKEAHKYDRDHQVASFIGLAPVEDSRFVCMVLVDDPQTAQHHGGNTAGPIFREIMEGIYYHPKLSPLSHRMAVVDKASRCDNDYIGMMAANAKQLAHERNCKIHFEGSEENGRVISMRRDMGDSLGLVLILDNVDGSRVPNFKGLSLKDAMEVASSVRMKIEFTGKGRVVAQSPKADEVLSKGQVCKLTLKEKS